MSSTTALIAWFMIISKRWDYYAANNTVQTYISKNHTVTVALCAAASCRKQKHPNDIKV